MHEAGRRKIAALVVASTIFIVAPSVLFPVALSRAQTALPNDAPIIQRGDAVVTAFSGVNALKPDINAQPNDNLVIDAQGAALQVFDLGKMSGPANAHLVDAPRQLAVPAAEIGQVFGVALDDGLPANGMATNEDPVPNIYATATSAYGLQIVVDKQAARGAVKRRTRIGSPLATWMDGQFGIVAGGGPGSIWKIDGRTGKASLFANVLLDGVANSGPALGSIAFDPVRRRLFVSDLQTGMIHAFDLNGREAGRYDHGIQGRTRRGLAPVAFDPNSRVAITNPAFNSENVASWGFAGRERQVWGLAIRDHRLFYAASDGPAIWSVGLTPSGGFADDARVEIEVKSRSGDPVSAISFDRKGTIYLGQRGLPVPNYDYKVMATPGTAEVLRYKRRTLPDGRQAWDASPQEYAIGHSPEHRSSNGGIALGYGYDRSGSIRYDVCEAGIWTTGEALRVSEPPDARLIAGGQTVVNGLQGNWIGAVRPANDPPMKSFYIDYDGQFADPGVRGHMGQVAIWGCSHAEGVASQRPGGDVGVAGGPGGVEGRPRRPRVASVGAELIVGKRGPRACEAGRSCTFDLSVTNAGLRTFDGRLFLGDVISVPGVAEINVSFTSPSIANCSPTALPFHCDVPMTLGAGATRTFRVTLDMPIDAVQPGGNKQGRNCFFASHPNLISDQDKNLDGFSRMGMRNLNQASPSGGPGFHCVNFQVTRPIDNVARPAGAVTKPIRNAAKPVADVAGPEGDVTGPAGAVTKPVRNAAKPAADVAGPAGDVTKPIGDASMPVGDVAGPIADATRPTGNADKPRSDPAKPIGDIAKAQIPLVSNVLPPAFKPMLSIDVAPSSQFFHGPGEKINYRYTVTNTGNVALKSFALDDPGVAGLNCAPVPIGGQLGVGAVTNCTSSYTTTNADVARVVTARSLTLDGRAVPDVQKSAGLAIDRPPQSAGLTPVACPLADFAQSPNALALQSQCEQANKLCGKLQPKSLKLSADRVTWTWDTSKPWFTGCDNPSNLAALSTGFPNVSLQTAKMTCDQICDGHHVARDCDFDSNAQLVDEVPNTEDLEKMPGFQANRTIMICPWRLGGNNGGPGLPAAPEKVENVAMSNNPTDFCWKKGGTGGCPSGFTDTGLGCALGGTGAAVEAVLGQVASGIGLAVSVVPVLGEVWGAFKSLLGGAKTAAKSAGLVASAKKIAAAVQQTKVYRTAKAKWEATAFLRHGKKGLVNGSKIEANLISAGVQGGMSDRKIWETAHLLGGIASMIPGPVGAVVGAANDFVNPICQK